MSLESLLGIVLIGFFLNAVANAHAKREHELEHQREAERLVPIIDLIGGRVLSHLCQNSCQDLRPHH